jgi:hypothetical protein
MYTEEQLYDLVEENLPTNGNKEITAESLRDVILEFINSSQVDINKEILKDKIFDFCFYQTSTNNPAFTYTKYYNFGSVFFTISRVGVGHYRLTSNGGSAFPDPKKLILPTAIIGNPVSNPTVVTFKWFDSTRLDIRMAKGTNLGTLAAIDGDSDFDHADFPSFRIIIKP